MAKAKDILNLEISEIENEALRDAVLDWIHDYNESGKSKEFELESKENIDQLYDLVSKYAPEAIKSNETKKDAKEAVSAKTTAKVKKSSDGKNGQILKIAILVKGDLDGILEKARKEDIEDADLVIVLELTEELEKALRKGDDEKVKQIVDDILKNMGLWKDKIQNMNGEATDLVKELLDEANQSVNNLLEELNLPPIEPLEDDNEATSVPAITRDRIAKIVKRLKFSHDKDMGDFEDEMYLLGEALENSLEEEDDQEFLRVLRETSLEYKLLVVSIQDQDRRIMSIKLLNEILEILGENPIDNRFFENPLVTYDEEGNITDSILTKELVEQVLEEITDIAIDLEGNDEEVLATLRLELEEALEHENHEDFRKEVVKTVKGFKYFVEEMEDTSQRKLAIQSFNKLINALGEIPLESDGKERVETEQQKAERIQEELENLKPELERCRNIIREADRKKKSASTKKPKPTVLNQLKTKILSLSKLAPKKYRENLEVQAKVEEVLTETFWKLVEIWGLNKVQAKGQAKEIKRDYEKLEEKVNRKERKDLAKKWKKSHQKLKESLKSKLNKEDFEKTKMKIQHIDQAIRLFTDTPGKVKKWLNLELNNNELKEFIPEYILSLI